MTSPVDLHTHTTASDGTLAPPDLLQKANDLAIRYLGIADHDSTAGYEAVLPLQSQFPDVRLIPSIEINAEGESACHVLGYLFDGQASGFQKHLATYRDLRLDRARAMVKKLQDLKVQLTFDEVLKHAQGGSVGRPHIADALREKGIVRSRQEAFDKYLKRDGAAYVPGEAPSAAEAIQLIRNAGGIPVLAHPYYGSSDTFLKQLVDQGLMGIEAYYPEHSKSLIQRYVEMAQKYGLVATGGSDFHGPRTGRTSLGCVDVPETVIEALEQAKTRV